MYSYRTKLIIPVIILILIVLSGLGALLGYLFKEYYIERISDRVSKEAEATALYLEDTDLGNMSEVQGKISLLGERLDVRITIIGLDGEILGETHADPEEMENHIARPEISEAIELGAGQEVRYSTTVEAELFYHAVPLEQNGENAAYLRIGMPIEQLNQVYRNIWALIIGSFFIAFMVIVIIATKLTNQIIRPVESARLTANQLAKGDFSARTHEINGRETVELNRSLNILAENLEQITSNYEIQQERLETLIDNMGSGLVLLNSRGEVTLVNRACNILFQEDTKHWLNKLYYHAIKYDHIIKLIQDILLKEKKQSRQISLTFQYEVRHLDVHAVPIKGNDDKLKDIVLVFHDITELKKLEQARKDFVANVSHELKTPVTSLKGFTETLLAGAMDDESLRERFLTIIANESDRLESLINDLLELSKIEGTQFTLNVQETDLRKLTGDVLTILSDKAAVKKIELKEQTTGKPVLEGDPSRIKQILINLVNNALMYTPEGGVITVRMRELAEVVILEVEDNGIGITRKELSRIFERFYRVERARTRNSGGTGLGLAIVKHLAEAHRAKLKVESEVGKGTVFRLAFSKKFQEMKSN